MSCNSIVCVGSRGKAQSLVFFRFVSSQKLFDVFFVVCFVFLDLSRSILVFYISYL